jgi:putative nucleotidyltransferase with HDIG domain
MIKREGSKTLDWKEILKYIFTIGVIMALSFLFPAEKSAVPNAETGKLWKKENLYAPYDFPVRKSEEQIKSEKDALEKSVAMVYSANPKDPEFLVNELINKLKKSLPSLTNYESFLKEKLGGYYLAGIVNDKKGSSSIELYDEDTRRSSPAEKILDKNEFADILISELSEMGISIAKLKAIDFSVLVEPSYVYNKNLHQAAIDNAKANWPLNDGIAKKGELIIAKGELVDDYAMRKLSSLSNLSSESKSASQNYWIVFIGYLLLSCMIIGVLLLYLRKNFPTIDDRISRLVFILMWPLLFSYLVFAFENKLNLSAYMIPFCIAPIIIKNFYSDRLALFVHIVVILIASFISDLGYEFTFLQILAGIVTVLVITETRLWNRFFIALLLILATYLLGYLGLSLIREGNFGDIEWQTFIWLMVNALLLLLAYPFIPLIEKLFGFTSSISLVELSDLNRPLLKELSLKAPGTLQHSLQVANLSEAAAEKIGANSLLVKTAALYHDIGKMHDPAYFIENTTGTNLHETLDNNFESAKIIIKHISEGLIMAKKAKLPKEIIDFISSHHGTTRVEYFYRKQLAAQPDEEFDESLFRYPGPLPRTKEQTIMMIADSLEAASKSLRNPTGQDIDVLVDKIINYKIDEGQLADSELSFQELEVCSSVFKSLLRSIYHVRVEYPGQ